jgi:hypothetical protein
MSAPDHLSALAECRRRIAAAAFRMPAAELSRQLVAEPTARDGNLSSHMLRVTEQLVPSVEASVLQACRNLGFPREILDVYVKPNHDIGAFSGKDGGRAVVLINSLMVEISDQDELAYVIGHELGHFLVPEANLPGQRNTVEGCMLSRNAEFTMDRIGLIACRKVDKAVSAKLKLLSGLTSRHLRMDATALVAQWREVALSPDFGRSHLHATHPPPGFRAKALIQFFGSDAYAAAAGLNGGEPIAKVNEAIGAELDRLIDDHARVLIADKLNKLSGWLCAFVASRGIKLRLADLRHGVCKAPTEIVEKCLTIVLQDTPAAQQGKVGNDKLIAALEEACQVAPGHTRMYLQSVAQASAELGPLLQQLDGMTRQQGIVVVPRAAGQA